VVGFDPSFAFVIISKRTREGKQEFTLFRCEKKTSSEGIATLMGALGSIPFHFLLSPGSRPILPEHF
jgi:hypothetical protein